MPANKEFFYKLDKLLVKATLKNSIIRGLVFFRNHLQKIIFYKHLEKLLKPGTRG